MNVFLLILQIVLLVVWFAVPAAAVIPAWVILLPIILVAVLWAIHLVVAVVSIVTMRRWT